MRRASGRVGTIATIVGLHLTLLAPVHEARADTPSVPEFPTSPAFTALDLNPTVVTRPTSTATFGSALLSAVDMSWRILPGVAIDVPPVWLYLGRTTTLEGWRASKGKQLASRFSLSLATARRPETSAGVTAALAARLVLIDDSDARFDEKLRDCID